MQNCVAPASRGRAGGAEHLVEVEERVHVDVGVVAGGLRAEGAVLGARARLGVDEALELDLGAAVGEAHPVGEGDEIGEGLEGQRGDGVDLGPGEPAPVVEQCPLGGGECGSGGHGGAGYLATPPRLTPGPALR